MSAVKIPPPNRFYYFAYGSCMCPVDLKRSLGESTHDYVVGPATLRGYRLGFYRQSRRRNCGALDLIRDPMAVVQGVLYHLPTRLSPRLDQREEGYLREQVTVKCRDRAYENTRTYVVADKLAAELPPSEGYSQVVLRGAQTCGLPEPYYWQLFYHMLRLQQQSTGNGLISAKAN